MCLPRHLFHHLCSLGLPRPVSLTTSAWLIPAPVPAATSLRLLPPLQHPPPPTHTHSPAGACVCVQTSGVVLGMAMFILGAGLNAYTSFLLMADVNKLEAGAAKTFENMAFKLFGAATEKVLRWSLVVLLFGFVCGNLVALAPVRTVSLSFPAQPTALVSLSSSAHPTAPSRSSSQTHPTAPSLSPSETNPPTPTLSPSPPKNLSAPLLSRRHTLRYRDEAV
jgi:hypothetical protein